MYIELEHASLYIMILKRHLTLLSRIINTAILLENRGPEREKSPGETKHRLEHTYRVFQISVPEPSSLGAA